jgi:8-oxo-dGTP pyrophosphatase MutT (NUDIX family)
MVQRYNIFNKYNKVCILNQENKVSLNGNKVVVECSPETINSINFSHFFDDDCKENILILVKNLAVDEVFFKATESMKFVQAAGGLVRNQEDEYLFIYRANRWDLPKGHREEGEELDITASREVEEETGLKVKPLFDTNPYSIQAAPVKGHIKNGKYVSAHVHYDVLYVFKASDADMDKIRVLPDENTAVEWWDFERVLQDPNVVDWAKPMFKKILNKMEI